MDKCRAEAFGPSSEEEEVTKVRVSKEESCNWAVWLEGKIVAKYMLAGDALAYASLLECDPRERLLALAV